ncbi:alpha/beta hydrolase [Nonomuraea sp. NPDC003709]|uniref:esterase/lipase family protein n=1 Tax=Nonomuraea sp. NPDC003709 TaxID=3154450 RepID=UPI0033A5329E
MTTVMLVHGAWHQPATWAKLETELHALGHATHTPALPSAGEHPTAGMHDDAAMLAAELASLAGPVVLLGHSYGGIPITEAAAGARHRFSASHHRGRRGGPTMINRIPRQPGEITCSAVSRPAW